MCMCDDSTAGIAGELGKRTVSLIVGGGAGGLIVSYWRDHRSGPAAREPRVRAC